MTFTSYAVIAVYSILVGSAYHYAYNEAPDYVSDREAEGTAHWDAGDYPTTQERGN